MNSEPIDNILNLLRTEQTLERHLIETRQEIRAACHNVAIHSPGVKTAPDIEIVDVYIPLEGGPSNILEVILDRLGRPDIRLIVEPGWVPMTEDELTEDELGGSSD